MRTVPVNDWIKHEILKWTVSGSALADYLQGIKQFQNFKKEDIVRVFETSKYVPRQKLGIMKT